MKLDKRIAEDCKIFSCFDTEQAQEYIITKGYFTDYYDNFSNVEKLFYGTCINIDSNSEFSYRLHNSDRKENYKFFLPEMFVKKEKILRPYKNISEFCNNTGCKRIGVDIITIRNKNNTIVSTLLYSGFCKNAVHLGGYVILFSELFNNYEFFCKGDWIPFGVEE